MRILFTNTIDDKYRYAIAYSGGYDSSWMVNQICKTRYQYKYALLHYVHNQPCDCVLELIDILNFCFNYNLTLVAGFLSPREICKASQRKFRYQFLFNTCINLKIYNLIVCHTRSDNIENMIMKTYKCYPHEVAMPAIKTIIYMSKTIKIIRPMLDIDRSNIVSEINPIVRDIINKDITTARIKIRYQENTSNPSEALIKQINKYKLEAQKHNDEKFQSLTYIISKQCILIPIASSINTNIINIKQGLFALNNKINGKINILHLTKSLTNKSAICLYDCKIQYNKTDIIISVLNPRGPWTRVININCTKIHLNNLFNIDIISSLPIDIKQINRYKILITFNKIDYLIDLRELTQTINLITYIHLYIFIIFNITDQIKSLT